MTGGGSIFGFTDYGGEHRITHGFELDCDGARQDNLQVNDHVTGWSFHLDGPANAICFMDEIVGSPNPPVADFNTYIGDGDGICRNVGGVSVLCYATWIFTDGGEVGGCLRDTAMIQVRNSDTDEVLIDVDGDVDCGNHQAHSK